MSGLRTFAGDVVRSEGERLLADWLYLNHVPYEYERPHAHATADAAHRQYHPDFFYPSIEVWHEHWGLDAHGDPPPAWTGYRESIAWKRELHRQHDTTLLETTWAGVMDGADLTSLAAELQARGAELRWDPDRLLVGPSTTPGSSAWPTTPTWTSTTCSPRPPSTSRTAGTPAPTTW